MTYKGLDIKKIREQSGKTQKELADLLGKTRKTIINWEKKEVISPNHILIVKNALGIESVNYSHDKVEEPTPEYKPEGKIIDVRELPVKYVTVIPIKGRGGLENAFYDKLYIDKLEKEKLTIKKPSSNGSEWFKIEVEGVSMDDSTNDFEGSKYSLAEGDWAYCRSIPRHHWKNKLHFNKVKVFCFFHNTRGILFKKVKEHNIENGELVLTSLNPDKKQFPDFTINIAECSYICNVIKVLSEF